ncbi:hypothetical protein CERZMDRAFT_92475 [Cercospora zeae-maydis SCOH1-5]|uniref:Uncharacterized protein n=1 Tax=Cercospora zeae-maydis SCOH1-5 TaxID=717836 RepID=A0A6A6FWI2_9PEZI|nr:hypothetical protein CERZMDRAFT_92475 [Cercospora zeae-maydis SCOH1-5]
MASLASTPNSTAPTSAVSSPEIKITDDYDMAAVVHLPGPMTRHAFSTPPRSHSIIIGPPENDGTAHLGARPLPVRSASSEATLTPVATVKPAPTSGPLEQSAQEKAKTKQLEQKNSSHGSLRMSLRSMASNGLLAPKKKLTPAESGRSSAANSGTASPNRVDTPEVKTIFATKTCPDLDAVSRALESLKAQAREPEDPLVVNLRSLEKKIQGAREDCAKLLTRAMQSRDQGRYEMCRALCIQIVQNQHSKVETKVYAYNILSTQASPGQVMNFLDEAAKLVKQCEEGAEKDKLTSVVAKLRERGLAKEREREAARQESRGRMDGNSEERRASPAEKTNGGSSPSRTTNGGSSPSRTINGGNSPSRKTNGGKSPSRKTNGGGSPSPKAGNGAMTPKSEKIINWASSGQAKAAS